MAQKLFLGVVEITLCGWSASEHLRIGTFPNVFAQSMEVSSTVAEFKFHRVV